jgi:hypothetical protein
MSEGNSEELEGKPKKRRGRWLRRLAIAAAVFVLLLLGGGYFTYDWMLGKARVLVVAELAKLGVHVEYDGIHQSPLRGVVFDHLTFYTNEMKDKPLLLVSDIALLPNWRQWFDGEEISAKLSLKNSEIRMLVEGEEVGKVERVNGLVTGTASGLEVRHFSASANGVDYQLAGRVDFGEGSGKGAGKEKDKAKDEPKHGPLIDFSFWKPLQQWLSIEASDGGGMKIVSSFIVDTADLDAMTASAQLSGQSFLWHGVAFDHLRAKVDYSSKDQVVKVEGLDLAYLDQLAKGACRYSIKSNSLQIDALDSQIDVLSLLEDFSGKKTEQGEQRKGEQRMILAKPPRLGVSGLLDFAEIKNSALQIEVLETEEVAVEFGGKVFAVTGLAGKLEMGGGRLHTLDSGISARYAKGDRRLTFDQERGGLSLKGDFDLDLANPAAVKATVALHGKGIAWSGVEFEKLIVDARYSGEKKKVDMRSIDLSYRGRPLSGACGYVLGAKTIEIKSLESEIDFLALANDFTGGKTKGGGQALVLQAPPRLGVHGRLDFGEIKNSDLTIQFLEADKVVVASGETIVELTGLQGKARFEGGKAYTLEPGLRAGFADGGVELNAEAAVMEEATPFHANLKLDDLSIAKLMSLNAAPGSGTEAGHHGRLFFTYDGSGGKDILLKDGKGDIRLINADFGRVPIISGLFQTLGRMVPSFGQRKNGARGEQVLTGSYVVENGVVTMDDLAIEADLTRIDAKVGYDVADKMTSFNGKANLSGAVGLVTGVASRLLEIEGGGPIDDITWRMKNLNAAGIVKSGLGGVMDTGKGAVKMGGDTAMGALQAGGKATKGALKVGEKGTQGVLNGAGKVGEGLKKVLPFTKKKNEPED